MYVSWSAAGALIYYPIQNTLPLNHLSNMRTATFFVLLLATVAMGDVDYAIPPKLRFPSHPYNSLERFTSCGPLGLGGFKCGNECFKQTFRTRIECRKETEPVLCELYFGECKMIVMIYGECECKAFLGKVSRPPLLTSVPAPMVAWLNTTILRYTGTLIAIRKLEYYITSVHCSKKRRYAFLLLKIPRVIIFARGRY